MEEKFDLIVNEVPIIPGQKYKFYGLDPDGSVYYSCKGWAKERIKNKETKEDRRRHLQTWNIQRVGSTEKELKISTVHTLGPI